jgi:hypothetical protein
MSVLGTVALVFYTFPYLGIIFLPLSVLYLLAAVFYRRTSVETKRLDSILRSQLYSSYSGQYKQRLTYYIGLISTSQKLLQAFQLFGPMALKSELLQAPNMGWTWKTGHFT